MFVLESGDKLQGDASAATVVDYHVSGITNSSTLKNLADGQLPISIGDLYTSASTDAATTITLVNTDSVARTVNLYHTPSGGTARRIIPKDLSLGAGYSLVIDGGNVSVLDTSGGAVGGSSLSGSEIKALYEANADTNAFTDADHSKLDGIETNATADQDASEIRALVDSATDSNVLTDALKSKLDGIEASATADQTGAEIKAAYEAEANAFTDAQFTKLAGIEALAEVTNGVAIDMEDSTLTRPNIKDYSMELYAHGSITGATSIDITNGNVQTATIGAALTFTFTNPIASGDATSFLLELTNGGAYAVTFPASVDWAGGTAPTLTASGVDILAFYTRDGGTTWHGIASSLDSK